MGFPGLSAEFVFHQELVHRSAVKADVIAEAHVRHASIETVGLGDDPVGHKSAVAAAENSEALRVDPGILFDGRVQADHQVPVVAPAPVVDTSVGERLSVSGASSRIDIDYGVARPCQSQMAESETVTVRPMETAVD